MVTKKEIAKENGYDLSDEEIAVLCNVWTNTPKNSLSGVSVYVDLSDPTDEWPNPAQRIFVAIDLVNLGLLEQHNENVNSFKLTEIGEALHNAFYNKETKT